MRTKLIILMCLLAVSGCTSSQVNELTVAVKDLNAGVDGLQEATIQLVADGVIKSEKLEKINENIDKVQEEVKAVITKAEEAIEPIEVAKTAWDATRLWNPYWGYGSAAFLILEMFRKRKIETT